MFLQLVLSTSEFLLNVSKIFICWRMNFPKNLRNQGDFIRLYSKIFKSDHTHDWTKTIRIIVRFFAVHAQRRDRLSNPAYQAGAVYTKSLLANVHAPNNRWQHLFNLREREILVASTVQFKKNSAHRINEAQQMKLFFAKKGLTWKKNTIFINQW